MSENGYKMVCGIETHVELATKTKIFCSCTTAFGGSPNTHCCEICTGQPGVLPSLNREAVRLAVRAGLVLNCRINKYCHMDRKNYFYPDLPKAYQISQADEPVCEDGFVMLDSGKKIRIERIHIEEDAGKLIHKDNSTLVDYNRAGVPLTEIVSRPDIESPEEAKEYAEKLQLSLRFAGVSDCRMQEGSMRCDVNLSLNRPGEKAGTRTETKNINSLTNIAKAIKAEAARQAEILSSGGKIRQATLRYDAVEDRISVMRIKENSDDYRYFPEPDIVRFYIPESVAEEERAGLPELPFERLARYKAMPGMTAENAGQIFRYKKLGGFFDECIGLGAGAKNSANLIIKGMFPLLDNEDKKESFEIKTKPKQFTELVILADEKKIGINRAVEVLGLMLECGKGPMEFIKKEELSGLDEAELEVLCAEAVKENAKAVEDIKNGKKQAVNVLLGYVMKKSKGRADSKRAAGIIEKIIG